MRTQQTNTRNIFEVPCFAALKTHKHFGYKLGYDLVTYAYPLRFGGIIFKGPEDPIAIHNVAKTKIKNLKLEQFNHNSN